MPDNASTFRERAGVLAAYLVIAAYVAIGFVQFVGSWLATQVLAFDPAWTGSMNGLAGGALGFLIGKQTTSQPGTTTITPTSGIVTTTTTVDTAEGKP